MEGQNQIARNRRIDKIDVFIEGITRGIVSSEEGQPIFLNSGVLTINIAPSFHLHHPVKVHAYIKTRYPNMVGKESRIMDGTDKDDRIRLRIITPEVSRSTHVGFLYVTYGVWNPVTEESENEQKHVFDLMVVNPIAELERQHQEPGVHVRMIYPRTPQEYRLIDDTGCTSVSPECLLMHIENSEWLDAPLKISIEGNPVRTSADRQYDGTHRPEDCHRIETFEHVDLYVKVQAKSYCQVDLYRFIDADRLNRDPKLVVRVTVTNLDRGSEIKFVIVSVRGTT